MKSRPSNSHTIISLCYLALTHFFPNVTQFHYFSIISFNYSRNSFFESINGIKILLERNIIGKHICAAEKMSFLRIWSHLLNKSLMETFIFCAVRAKILKNTITVLGSITNIRKSCARVVTGKRL